MTARMTRTSSLWIALAGLLIAASGCTQRQQIDASSLDTLTDGRDRASAPTIEERDAAAPAQVAPVDFKDHVQSNAEVPAGLEGLVFLDTTGRRVALSSYLGKKNVVLVFTEGFSGMLCPFCKTQTSRLIDNYQKFRALDAEVLVVYPGTRDHVDEFIEAAKKTEKRQVDEVPFPIVLDEEMKAVDFFSIRSNLAHPSTYVIDKKGNVKLAYVGKDMSADRPSVTAILKQIEASNN